MADLRNASGCVDPVQHDVIEAEERRDAEAHVVIRTIKTVAEAYGFEFTERFILRDKKRGKIYR